MFPALDCAIATTPDRKLTASGRRRRWFCVLLLWLCVASPRPGGSLAADVPVALTTTDDRQLSGSLRSIDDNAVTLLVGQTPQTIAISDVQSLVVRDTPVGGVGSYSVQWVDGSSITAGSVTSDGETVTIRFAGSGSVAVPIRSVASIRLRGGAPGKEWLGMLDDTGRGDVLVVRRGENQLEPLRGIVVGITADAVEFELDGNAIKAPIAKLEGIVLGGGDRRGTKAGDIVVTEAGGSRILATALTLAGDGTELSIRTGLDVTFALPMSAVAKIQWSGGATLLAQSEAVVSRYTDPLALPLVSSDLAAAWWGTQVVGEGDLLMPGGAATEYRVDDGVATLAGSLRRADEIEQGGRVAVAISLDDRRVWYEELQDTRPLGFEIDVSGGRRVRIEVLPLDDGTAGDLVRIVRPRLVR